MKNNKINKIKPTTSVTLEELFKCLNFYANEESYISNTGFCEYSKVEKDLGSKARKILKKLVKENLREMGIENNL